MTMKFLFLKYVFVFVFEILLGFCLGIELAENRLHQYLLNDRKYRKLIRPAGNDSVKLTVKLGMRLSQLLDMDEKNQIMTSSVWLRHEWNDLRLTWDPDVYDGIKMTHIPSDDLWRPDIVLYNNADGEYVVTLLTKATVFFTGKIVWEPPVIYKSYCPIDVQYFPFDMQVCFMKFGVWTYDGHQVDLQHLCDHIGIMNPKTNEKVIDRGIDLKDFYQNVEWDIINVTARRKEKFYPCCQEPYPDITFNITLRRRTLFYSLNLIMPCVSISLLTVLVFYLPSDSKKKITLSISILVALTVFFLLLYDMNPPTSLVIPLIGKYLLFTMIVVTMSIFLTVYTLRIHSRKTTTHKMKPWVKRVFTEILPRILLVKRPDLERKPKVSTETTNGIEGREIRNIYGSSTNEAKTHEINKSSTFETLRHRKIEKKLMKKYPSDVREALHGVKFIADHVRSADADSLEERDWKYVAMVMDRLFLYIFTTACICGTLSIFLYAPSLYDPRPPLRLHEMINNCTY